LTTEPETPGPGDQARGEFDLLRIERAVTEILLAIGEDPERDGLRDTPARVARAYAEQFAGLRQRPQDVLTTVFDADHDEMVIVRDIEVYGTCEHHLVPFIGVAHIGYIPNVKGQITGLSKLARLVDVYARRPQVQERMTSQNAGPARRGGGDRGRAPLHDHARGTQAGRAHGDLGGARRLPRQQRHPGRGDEPDLRAALN